MKIIIINALVWITLGTGLLFKKEIRSFFSEPTDKPSYADLAWKPPLQEKKFSEGIGIQFFNPHNIDADTYVKNIIQTLGGKSIHTASFLNTPKTKSNIYVRELSKYFLGIEKVVIIGSYGLNIYALRNLLLANPSVHTLDLREVQWKQETLNIIIKGTTVKKILTYNSPYLAEIEE